ncbi:hypothetical protein [Paenibacillus sp. GP183]|jgi:hypothetical protein|uniref:hypothetical protein n=1 Tax=Paenibacillus sp. GP183 TaxID=1882751 RepID=UPI00089BFB5F|nr:hypothetical protein [Paenibacillus sp. GP183]SEC34553.1 hypothetical protein SAMN05443246_3786 [Paenibacillus sp. GP183]
MDKLIEELENLTLLGLAELPGMLEEQLTKFMEQRTKIIDILLQHTPSQNEKMQYIERLEAILSHDTAFIAKMNFFKEEAQDQLNKIEASRKQRNVYDSGYNGESFFFDKKK